MLIVFYHLPHDLGIYPANVIVQTPLSSFVSEVFSLGGTIGLTLFFFLSGFAIDLNNKGIASQADIMAFFRKRAKRIYPLYWVAVALNLVIFLALVPQLHLDVSQALATFPPEVGRYDSLSSVVIIFLGAQGLLYPRFIGLEGNWFIGTILICYLLYPIIAYFGKNNALRITLVSIAVFCGLLAVHFTLNVVGDTRLYTFFGIFVAGIIASRANLFRSGAVEKRIAAPCAVALSLLILAQALTGVPTDVYFGFSLGSGLNYAFNYAAFLIWYDVHKTAHKRSVTGAQHSFSSLRWGHTQSFCFTGNSASDCGSRLKKCYKSASQK